MPILLDIHEAVYDSKLYSNYVLMRCVFHDDNHPSLLVYPDKYRCLSCSAWGKTEDLLFQLQSHSAIVRPQKSKNLRNPFNKWLREKSLFQVLKTAYHVLRDFPQQGSYLKKRKLTTELITNLKMGYLEGFYTIPILDTAHKPVGALLRAGESIPDARYFIPSGQDPNLLYSPDWGMVMDAKQVYLTYGVFDSIAIYQCGRPAMSTTSGKRLHPSALKDFRKKITIVPDKHEEVDAAILANNLGWRGNVLCLDYPDGIKDPSELNQIGKLQGLLQ